MLRLDCWRLWTCHVCSNDFSAPDVVAVNWGTADKALCRLCAVHLNKLVGYERMVN